MDLSDVDGAVLIEPLQSLHFVLAVASCMESSSLALLPFLLGVRLLRREPTSLVHESLSGRALAQVAHRCVVVHSCRCALS